MRTISFIFAFAVLFLGPSMAGSADVGLQGIGTFDFGSPSSTMNDASFVIAAVR